TQYQQLWRLAESEVAAPTPHVRSQCCHRRLQAHALGLPCDFPNPLLEPLDSFRRDSTPDCRTLGKGESEKLPLLRPRHCALLLVYTELETFGDEPSDASHHLSMANYGFARI